MIWLQIACVANSWKIKVLVNHKVIRDEVEDPLTTRGYCYINNMNCRNVCS